MGVTAAILLMRARSRWKQGAQHQPASSERATSTSQREAALSMSNEESSAIERGLSATGVRVLAGFLVIGFGGLVGLQSWNWFKSSAPPPYMAPNPVARIRTVATGLKCHAEIEADHFSNHSTQLVISLTTSNKDSGKPPGHFAIVLEGSAQPPSPSNLRVMTSVVSPFRALPGFPVPTEVEAGLQYWGTGDESDDHVRRDGSNRKVDMDDFDDRLQPAAVGSAITIKVPPARHKYAFRIVDETGRSVIDGGSGIVGSVGYDGRSAELRLYTLMSTDIERAEGFRHTYMLPEVWGFGSDYRDGYFDNAAGYCLKGESYAMKLVISEKDGPPRSGPSSNELVDMAVPTLPNADEYRWVGDGYPTLSPILRVIERSAEQNAQRDLFLAGIGLGAAVSIVTWGLQIMPWLRLLRLSSSRRNHR